MPERTWLRVKPKPPSRPKVPDDLWKALDIQAAVVVANLKKRFCNKPRNMHFNRCDDFYTRWHRDALYLVVVMRTLHGRPPTFETHAARMDHAGKGKFNLAFPMRRGWNTVKRGALPEDCLQAITGLVHF